MYGQWAQGLRETCGGGGRVIMPEVTVFFQNPVATMPSSSSGLGRCPLKAETTGSNPVGGIVTFALMKN